MVLKHSVRTGLSFGLTSAIITTLGLMVGLHSSTGKEFVVIGGVLTIAIADALSDALGIHVSEESENRHIPREIWESTISTFLAKLFFGLTFIVPVLLFELKMAIIVAVLWGLLLLGILSFLLARDQKVRPWKMLTEHMGIALIVVVLTHYVGDLIARAFD